MKQNRNQFKFIIPLMMFLICNSLFAQPQTVTGSVISSEDNMPLPGVSVVIKGTTIGTTTDFDGNYSINVPNGTSILVFTYIGFSKQEVSVQNRAVIDITMQPSETALDEVVVLGYSTTEKASLTAAVETIKTDELQSVAVSNASSALAGRAPGLITVQSTGEVGNDETQIFIRGVGSTGNTNPLIIVDGVPRNSLNDIDVNNVESYTVLKDAAAVAPYGVGGANGVILVTTKKGKVGRIVVNYKGWTGFQKPTNLPDYVNSYQYASTYNTSEELAGVPVDERRYSPQDLDNYRKSVAGVPGIDKNLYPNADAGDALFKKNSTIQNHSISLSGGSEKVQFYSGFSYLGQNELWQNSDYQRIGVIAKVDANPSDQTKFGISFNTYNDNVKKSQTASKDFYNAYQSWLPIEAITYTDQDGNSLLNASTKNNTILSDLYSKGRHINDETTILASTYVEQTLAEGLSLKGVVSYDWTIQSNKNWNEPKSTYYNLENSANPYSFIPVTNDGRPSLFENYNETRAFTLQGILNYKGRTNDHRYGFLGVAEKRTSKFRTLSASRSHYEIPIDEISFGSSEKDFQNNGGLSSETAQVGFVGQLNYSFKDKYLIEVTGRYDGSYYFAPGKRWGFFPAMSLAWRLSEEGFMSSFENLDQLKLRISGGQSGALAGGPNQYSSALLLYGNSYPFNGNPTQGVYAQREGNPDITWEKADKYDIGLDYSFFNGTLSGKVDYFFEKRNNMLVSPSSIVPQEYGISLAQVNAGVMQNQGVEAELRYNQKITTDFELSAGGVFTFARNKLIETFENDATRNNPNRSRTGKPLNTIFGYESLGLFQVSDDINGDGIINSEDGFPNQNLGGTPVPGSIRYANIFDAEGETNPVIDLEDETRIGYPTVPEIIYGFDLGAFWKGFNLNVLFQGAANSNAVISGPFVNYFKEQHNLTTDNLDFWTPQNPNARYPIVRPNGQLDNDITTSSFYLINMNYLRLKNMEIGYTFPRKIIDQIPFEKIKLYMSGTNLVTFDKTRGLLDPEQTTASTNGANAERGWRHPINKVLSLGINLTF